MALTQQVRKALRAEIIPHKEQFGGEEQTPTGLIRTGKGFIIPPSENQGTDLKTGPLTSLTPSEQALFPHLRQQVVPESMNLSPVLPAQTPVKRSRRKKAEAQVPVQPQLKATRILIPGVGELPTQYAHVWRGNKVAVLGITPLSYVPAEYKEGGVQGMLSFSDKPSVQYVYLGAWFDDDSGVRNLVLVELPGTGAPEQEDDETDSEDEEYEDDDDEEQRGERSVHLL